MRSSEIEDPGELMGFIPLVFDSESKLKRADFIDKIMSKECSWIFDALKIKRRHSHFAKPSNKDVVDGEIQEINSKAVGKKGKAS